MVQIISWYYSHINMLGSWWYKSSGPSAHFWFILLIGSAVFISLKSGFDNDIEYLFSFHFVGFCLFVPLLGALVMPGVFMILLYILPAIISLLFLFFIGKGIKKIYKLITGPSREETALQNEAIERARIAMHEASRQMTARELRSRLSMEEMIVNNDWKP